MATKLIKRTIANDFNGLNIAFGYCELQTLLSEYWKEKIGYATGIYGWACDFYYNLENTGVNIVTGYNTDRTGCKPLTEQEKEAFYKLEKEFSALRYRKNYDTENEEYQKIRSKFKNLLLQVKERVLENI